MKKKSKLLNVVSIILIVFGALGTLSMLLSFAMADVISESFATLGLEAPSAMDSAVSLISTLITLAAGILGVAYKSKKSVLIIGILYCLMTLVGIIQTISMTGFAFLSIILSLILPALYMWGWYQSE